MKANRSGVHGVGDAIIAVRGLPSHSAADPKVTSTVGATRRSMVAVGASGLPLRSRLPITESASPALLIADKSCGEIDGSRPSPILAINPRATATATPMPICFRPGKCTRSGYWRRRSHESAVRMATLIALSTASSFISRSGASASCRAAIMASTHPVEIP